MLADVKRWILTRTPSATLLAVLTPEYETCDSLFTFVC